MRSTTVAAMLLLAALVITACGDTTTRTVTKTVQADATTPRTDLSGVKGEEDPEETGDCDASGINADVGNEGRCKASGRTYVVVNRTSELRLNTLTARLDDVTVTSRISSADLGETDTADGVFVVFRLTVRNRANVPMTFTTGTSSQAALIIGKNTYTDDFDVQNGYATDSFMWQDKAIQPGASQTGTVSFDIPRGAAARIDRSGNLDILNFGDAFADEEVEEIGVIRLWQ